MEIARCIGIAGAGKTTDAMQVIDKVRHAGFHLQQIGFMTMTRVAREEASRRASDQFGVPVAELERTGWFRTCHSVCYRLLGVEKAQVLANKEGNAWIEKVVGEVVLGGSLDDDSPSDQFKGFTSPAVALRIWDLARSLLQPYKDVYERCRDAGGLPVRPPLDFYAAVDYVEKYEAAKIRDERLDFTDLLLRYAGWQATVRGCEKVSDGGEIPDVPVWVIDEHQDASILLDLCQRRITSSSTWTYLYADPSQSIYGFSGASAKNFMGWPASKERSLLKSWRCPRAILEHGRAILEMTDGWKAPPWEPRCEGGTVEVVGSSAWTSDVNAGEPTLALARTNEQASGMGHSLTQEGIPWRYFKGNGGLVRPSALRAWKTVRKLLAGEEITGADWLSFLTECPSGTEKGSCDLLTRGTKAKFKKADDFRGVPISGVTLSELGATSQLMYMMETGKWVSLIDGVDRVAESVRVHGIDLTENPKVLVATIHGSKGAQAESVFLHAGMPYPVQKAIAEDDEALKEERRLYYVGSTRASERLFIVRGERGHNFQDAFAGA